MNIIARLAVLTAAAIGMLGLAAPAQAAPAAGDTVAAASQDGPIIQDTCVWYVLYNSVAVRENPDTDSVIRKFKNAGDRVTSPCRAEYDTEGATWFTSVYCGCATDGIGWIRSSSLRR